VEKAGRPASTVLGGAGTFGAILALSLLPPNGYTGPVPRVKLPAPAVSAPKPPTSTATSTASPPSTVNPSKVSKPVPTNSRPGPRVGRTTTTKPVPHVAPFLQLGSSGPAVQALQRRLLSLGYWLVAADGTFDDSTEQAVYAFQKAAGARRDGIVGPQTEAALDRGVVPQPRPVPGYAIEVNLESELVMFVTNSKLDWVVNTSTGGGYTYCVSGSCAIADTPVGQFSIYSEVDGTVVDALGELWRPKYFDGGFALHGDSYVPPFPVSHGCVRVSDEAIDWIWSNNLAPVGTPVWVY
jgi:Putative peptidoglycan binding domain/L,D-transpeptidase catalytic domain